MYEEFCVPYIIIETIIPILEKSSTADMVEWSQRNEDWLCIRKSGAEKRKEDGIIVII